MTAPYADDYRQAQGRASSDWPTLVGGRRRGRRAGGAAIGAAVASCTVPAFPWAGGTGTARLAYGSGGAIVVALPDGSDRRVRVQPPPGGIARDPAWSPDGKRIAYAYTPPIVASRGGDPLASFPVTDLHILDVETGATTLLRAHERPGETLERPAWSPDGRAVFANAIMPVLEGTIVRTVIESVVRVAVTDPGAGMVVIASGVQDVAVSPDGRTLAWVRRGTDGRVVEVVSADGTGPRGVVGPEAVDGAAWPRFSRDGRRLSFSAASPFTPVPTVTPLPRRASLGAGVAVAAGVRHGVPMDVFSVGIDGAGLARLTTVGEDSPQAAWSPDGLRLAIVSGGGTYVLRVGTTDLQPIDLAGGHGAIDWR